MVERFGMQDHDVGIGSTRLQNPTNAQTHITPGAPEAGFAYSQGVFAPEKAEKGIVTSVLLALVFGPFGLLYTTWKGGAVMIALMVLAGYLRGGSMQAVESEAVMGPIWSCSVVVSVIWTFLAAKAFNQRHQEAYDARKAKEKEGR